MRATMTQLQSYVSLRNAPRHADVINCRQMPCRQEITDRNCRFVIRLEIGCRIASRDNGQFRRNPNEVNNVDRIRRLECGDIDVQLRMRPAERRNRGLPQQMQSRVVDISRKKYADGSGFADRTPNLTIVNEHPQLRCEWRLEQQRRRRPHPANLQAGE